MARRRMGMDGTERPSAAIVYCRVSTRGQEQEGTSLDSQEAACVKRAGELGYVVGRITREVYSGGELYDRPKLSQDRADIKAGRFQALIVYAVDRLSRDPIHLAIIADDCEYAGCALHFVSEPLDDTDEGKLVRYIKGYSGKKEREKIRERQMRGKYTRALQGKLWNHGPELYGYRRDKDSGVRAIYDTEARIVELIFTWAAVEHMGAPGIARRLNDMGVSTPSHGKMEYPDPDRAPRWGKTQIAKMLKNPAYKGETYAWRTQRPASKKDRARPDFDSTAGRIIRPETEWVRLPDGTTPPIVSPDLWQKAQDALRERRSAVKTRNETRQYLLRGLIWCAVCGKRLYSSAEQANTAHPTRVYRCASRHSAAGKCGGARVPARPCEDWVWDRISAVLRDPNLIAEELRRRQDEGPDATLTSDLETARRELARREKKQADLMRRFTEAEDDSFPWELVEREIKRLEHEKAAWQRQIADIDSRLSQQALAQEQLVTLHAYCERVAYHLDTFGFEEKRLALEALEVRVTGSGREWTISGSIPLDTPEAGAMVCVSAHNMSML